ncbi:hypothetical protein NMY22_g10066 [Coprinellus aureogranulatus]|nr:hypothetical protein NMY22_g10066 [Coprinellus aureogranulatus]
MLDTALAAWFEVWEVVLFEEYRGRQRKGLEGMAARWDRDELKGGVLHDVGRTEGRRWVRVLVHVLESRPYTTPAMAGFGVRGYLRVWSSNGILWGLS